jgi:hypothetical protein
MNPVFSIHKVLPVAVTLALLGVRGLRADDYPTTVLSDNPSAYYRLEETSGNTAFDASINGINATYFYNSTNSDPQLGLAGIDTNSILFNGGGFSSDVGYVDIPSGPLITPIAGDGIHGAPFSCELWVQPTAQPATYSVPIEMAQYPNGWNIYVTGADSGAISYFILNMPNLLFSSALDFPISFLSWYHLVVTFDGTNALFYVNGVAHGPFNVASYAPASGSDAHVGVGFGVGWTAFIGGVDEVAFYTNVLSASQIMTHYTVGTNSFRATFSKPSILSDPASTTNYSGLPVTFTVSANGTTPLHFQWLKNSLPVGPDDRNYTFTCQYPADDGAAINVIVTNNYGSATSQVATLTVATNLNIISPPGSITRNVGSYAAFHVTANGAVPITYQWTRSTDGVSFQPITGATNKTLWVSNVQLGMSGYQYAAQVTGPFASDTAGPATLSVQTRAVNVPLTGYGAVVAADKPVAYWRLDEANASPTAVDAVGSFDGTYTPNLGTITYGVTPPGIPNDTDPAITLAGGSTIQIPFAPELNPDIPWSIESWVRPSSLATDGGDYRVVLSSEYNLFPNPYNGWYIYQQPANNFAFVPQPGNAFIVAGPDDPGNGNQLVAGKWYYIVVTDDGVNFNFYINGELRSSYPVASAGFIPNGDGINQDGTPGIGFGLGNTVIGQRTDGAFNTFLGTVDDTAIYNYALSSLQVQSHYLNTTALTIAPGGANQVVLTWPIGVLQSSVGAAGPYQNVVGATSPFTTNTLSGALFFRVKVQ